MDCLEFRRRLGAEPHSRAAELLAHRERFPAMFDADRFALADGSLG